MKKHITITIEPLILDIYKKVCLDNGYKVSTRIEHLIKKDIEEHSKTKNINII